MVKRTHNENAVPLFIVFAFACTQEPASIEARVASATAHLERGDLSGAEATLLKTVAEDPKAARAWDLLGLARYRMGNVAGAAEACRAAVRIEPGSGAYRNNLGYYLFELKDPRAIEHLRRAVELDPKSTHARNNLGVAQERLGLHKIVSDPKSVDAWVNLGLAKHREGDLASAIEATRRALDLDPRSFFARNNLGYFLLEQGEVQEARVELERAVELNPSSELARNNLKAAKSR